MSDLYTWCRRRAENFREWEHVEMSAFPTGHDRDVALVEWVVRTLGNPELSESRDVLAELNARHAASRTTPPDTEETTT